MGNNKSHIHKGGSANSHAGHTHEHGGVFGRRTELIFSLLCGTMLGIGYLTERFGGQPASAAETITNFSRLPIIFYVFAYFFGGYFTLREAIITVRKGQFEVDFLMLVAALGAATLGKWAEGSLLLFLFSLGHALENMAMNKAKQSIEALAALAPKTALVRRGDQQTEIPVAQLQKNDIVIVKPNSRIPADGMVVAGNSAVNQAPITGESVPVDKLPVSNPDAYANNEKAIPPANRVFAGTINGAGALEILVLREAKDSTLARVVQMVQNAEQQQSPTQQFTKKVERYFVPAVLILVILLLFAFVIVDETFRDSFYRAMAVLVAASPCALAISTPSAVLSGVARAARQGVLVKGGRPLEELGVLTALAFDKTGTLTEGKPVLNAIVPLNGTTEHGLLQAAIAVERLSDHPLAAAIVKGGLEKLNGVPVPEAIGMRAITGKGIEAMWQQQRIAIGNAELFREDGQSTIPDNIQQQVTQLQLQGNTTMIVQQENTFIGILGVMDVPRPEAAGVLQQLKQMGIQKMIMLTGDNQRVADAVARQIGLTEARGDLLPEEKVAAIQQLKQQENKLAMIGDGVNDAPAMASSTVGIAMGAAGSDVALETADIALMGDKLSGLPFAIGLSKASKRIINQNLVISLGMVALLVPLTIAGVTNIGPAVAAHEGSTLIVVLNALRLLAYNR